MEQAKPEKGIAAFAGKAWRKGGASRVLCIVCAIVILAAVVAAVFLLVKVFDKGENVLLGSWHYDKKVYSAGDMSYDMYFSQDGAIYIVTELATNTGTYALVKGGPAGAYVTYISGEEIMYDYILDGDRLTVTNQDGYSMVLTRQ